MFGQSKSQEWKVFLNTDTIALNLYFDSTANIIEVNPESDYLRFIKLKGQPEKGKIKFISGKGVPSGINYPLPIASYKRNKPAIVDLKKIAKNYRKESIDGLYIQLVEVDNRTIQPIIIVQFKTQ